MEGFVLLFVISYNDPKTGYVCEAGAGTIGSGGSKGNTTGNHSQTNATTTGNLTEPAATTTNEHDYTAATPYDSGYSHGCSDAKIS